MKTYLERKEDRRKRPVHRAEDLPPRQRKAYERVTAYLLANPGTSDFQACMATGVGYWTWRIARERIDAYAAGVADDVEAFLEWDDHLLRGIG